MLLQTWVKQAVEGFSWTLKGWETTIPLLRMQAKRMHGRPLKCICSLLSPQPNKRRGWSGESASLSSWKKELPTRTRGWRASSSGAVGLSWPKTNLKTKRNKNAWKNRAPRRIYLHRAEEDSKRGHSQAKSKLLTTIPQQPHSLTHTLPAKNSL